MILSSKWRGGDGPEDPGSLRSGEGLWGSTEVESQNPSEWALYHSNFSEFYSVSLGSLICEKGSEYSLQRADTGWEALCNKACDTNFRLCGGSY